jgi:Zn-dependent protease
MMDMSSFDWGRIAFLVSVWALPVLFAITLHEAAHGFVAWRLGDDMAMRLGRVSFNPLRHIDAFGTVVLPALLLFFSGGRLMFGYAKPVPVDFGRLGRPRRDMVLVAAAGPFANFLLLAASALGLKALAGLPPSAWGGAAANPAAHIFDAPLWGAGAEWAAHNLINSAWINAVLMLFNLFPIPPLDGGRIAVGLLPASPARALARLERHGIILILGALFLLPWLGRMIGIDLDLFWWLVGAPAGYLVEAAFALAGVR